MFTNDHEIATAWSDLTMFYNKTIKLTLKLCSLPHHLVLYNPNQPVTHTVASSLGSVTLITLKISRWYFPPHNCVTTFAINWSRDPCYTMVLTFILRYLKGPDKRRQHFNATSGNIVTRNVLHTFGHVGSSLKVMKFFLQHFWMLKDVAHVWPAF